MTENKKKKPLSDYENEQIFFQWNYGQEHSIKSLAEKLGLSYYKVEKAINKMLLIHTNLK